MTDLYFLNEGHKARFEAAVKYYDIDARDREKMALIYCVTAVGEADDYVEIDGGSMFIRPEELTGVLSSGEQLLVSLGYHLYTWRDEYAVPEINFCRLDASRFEVVICALRLRTGNW